MITKKEQEQLFRNFMQSLGLNTKDPEMKDTPRRVVDMYQTLLSGRQVDISKFFDRPLPTKHSEMTILKDMSFVSLCPHHLQMYMGKVHIAFIPDQTIIGLSKFPSAVKALARQPILQETFTSVLADTIDKALQPIGVMVIVEAQHLCTTVPGMYDYECGTVSKPDFWTITSALRGLFLKPKKGYSSESARQEALTLIFRR
jgi:GTP cyclohydrolase I